MNNQEEIKFHIVGDDYDGRLKTEYNTWQVERIYDIILHHYGRKGDEIFNLSVGSCDGTFHDTISAYMSSYRWKGMFIEPIPDAFEALTKHVETSLTEGCILENTAVSNNERTDTMCYIPWKTIRDEGLDDAIIGMATLLPPKNGFESDEETKVLLDKYGELIDVPVTTVNNLLQKHNIENIDFCTIDTEGHDYEVFQEFDVEKYLPKVIKFELFNEEKDKLIEIFDRLINAGYMLTNQEGCDIMAFHTSEIEKFKKNRRWSEVTRLGDCIEGKGFRIDKDGNFVDVPENIEEGDYFQDDEPLPKTEENNYPKYSTEGPSKTTIVTGIWDLKREDLPDSFKRSFQHYLDKFEELLQTDCPMIVYIDSANVDFVWKHRSPENTHVVIKEAEDF